MKTGFIELSHIASLSASGEFFFVLSSAGSSLVNSCPAFQFSSLRQESRKLGNIDSEEHTGKRPGYGRPVMLDDASVPHRSLGYSA